MSNNTGKYLKPARRVTSPSVVFTICVDTSDLRQRKQEVYTERVFRNAVATVTRRRNGRWSVPKIFETTDCIALRKWVEAQADTRRRNYVVCPIASDVLTLTKWWDHVEATGARFERCRDQGEPNVHDAELYRGYSIRRLCLRRSPDIFDYSYSCKRYIWLSGTQFIDSSTNDVAATINYGGDEGLFGQTDYRSTVYDTRDTALIWSKLFCHLSNWWRECSTAPFGLTVGSMALGILRSHIKPKTLSTHRDTYAHQLERSACYGGRASLWFVGTVGNAPVMPVHGQSTDRQRSYTNLHGPVRLIDVRSMYPHLLSDRLFPCKYQGRHGSMSPSELESITNHFGTISSVTIATKTGEFPKREGKRLIYPTGTFQTVLTGPEIQAIRSPDKLIAVHDGALYTLGKPFKEAASVLLEMRTAARKKGNKTWELFAKSVGNNLGGKLAQRRTVLRPRPDILPERQWGEWIVSRGREDRAIRYRSYAGLVYEYVPEETGYGPYTPSFAYLTAYGRLYMRNLRKLLPLESVLSQDTDGIWVIGDDAYNILVDKGLFGESPGQLQVKETTDNAVFLSPRHYYTDRGWTLAGFHEHEFNVNKMTVADTYTENPVTRGVRSAPTSLVTRQRLSALVLEHAGGEITPYGWVNPIYVAPPRDI